MLQEGRVVLPEGLEANVPHTVEFIEPYASIPDVVIPTVLNDGDISGAPRLYVKAKLQGSITTTGFVIIVDTTLNRDDYELHYLAGNNEEIKGGLSHTPSQKSIFDLDKLDQPLPQFLIPIVDTTGQAETKYISVGNLLGTNLQLTDPPASAYAEGSSHALAVDEDFIYTYREGANGAQGQWGRTGRAPWTNSNFSTVLPASDVLDGQSVIVRHTIVDGEPVYGFKYDYVKDSSGPVINCGDSSNDLLAINWGSTLEPLKDSNGNEVDYHCGWATDKIPEEQYFTFS